MNFTHHNLTIEDIKKIKATTTKSSFYKIKFKQIDRVVSITSEIFEHRILAHFLKTDMNYVHRNDIMSCRFNVNATEGQYYRLMDSKLTVKQGKPNSLYINFIDIAGPILETEGPYFTKYEMANSAVTESLPF